MVILLSYIFVHKILLFQNRTMQFDWCFYHVFHGSRSWPSRSSEGIKKIQNHETRKTGISWTRFSDGGTVAYWKLRVFNIYSWREARLFHMAEQGDLVKHTDKQGDRGYDLPLNKKGLANLCRNHFCLCRETVFRPEISGERKLWWAYSAHTLNILTRTRRRLCHFPLCLIPQDAGRGVSPFSLESEKGHWQN